MAFEITKDALDKIAAENQITAADILGVMAHDLYEDIKNQGADAGYTKLPVGNEKDFITYLVNLTMNVSRIYNNNKEVFSDENYDRRWQRAIKKFDGFIDQLDVIDANIKSLQGKINEADKKEREYNEKINEADKKEREYKEKIKNMSGLEEKLKQKEEEVAELKVILEKVAQVDKDIAKLKNEDIPAAHKQLESKDQQYNTEKGQYDALMGKVKELEESSEKIKIDIGSYKESIGKIGTELEKKKEELKNLKEQFPKEQEQLSETRKSYGKQKLYTKTALDNHMNQIRVYEEEQKWLSDEIGKLLKRDDDGQLRFETYGFKEDAYIKELNKKIKAKESDLKAQIDNEMKLLKDILTRLQ